jgi:methyl-accepting chemotaxis protein
MSECEFSAACPFFEDKMPGTQMLIKDQFCRTNFAECARFMVRKALGKEGVPADLYPHQKKMAQDILAR